MRDRVIALALRRQALITKETLDLQIFPGLETKDLLDEVHKSKVYDSDTKNELIEVTCRLASLCIIVTDLLSLMASQESDKSLRPKSRPREGRAKNAAT
ncbi:cutinase transcription factor 1 beta [Verticillium alfalfae VaMs.102]|uniref:Cutinase transcription factor 1 beta n=1 Tax=Verticillium alfalfae (strain VaMs.102 / ATCC MYA-4576 / FGSC 10136) TaxID=526221 RepID=C9SUJ0_VERA1|nr:cutinase transcription factor 1 beta [Verticillium alfalfae VaMs.102]EEY22501.1 cutinase transcription factor 1 beta [Verticillium alfalfae VaMs.102]